MSGGKGSWKCSFVKHKFEATELVSEDGSWRLRRCYRCGHLETINRPPHQTISLSYAGKPEQDHEQLIADGKIEGSPLEAMTDEGLKRFSKIKISSGDCNLIGGVHTDPETMKSVLILGFGLRDEKLFLCENNSLKKSVTVGLHLSEEHALELRRILDEMLKEKK